MANSLFSYGASIRFEHNKKMPITFTTVPIKFVHRSPNDRTNLCNSPYDAESCMDMALKASEEGYADAHTD